MRVGAWVPASSLEISCLLAALAQVAPLRAQASAQAPLKLTVIVDAFGAPSALTRQWGYAALVEVGGQRILFDTGNDSAGFAENVRRLGIDLRRLDAVIISHRHGDHTAGLRHVTGINPNVPVFAPDDEAFGGATPARFFLQPAPELPAEMRYFGGNVPAVVPHGSAWQGLRVVPVSVTQQVAPGVRVVRNVAPSGPFADTPELSLVIDTPQGQVIVVGCSHPGVERIVASVADANPRIALLAGGLHLVNTPPADVERLATALRDEFKVALVAPGHCTGERAFAILQRVFAKGYRFAGVGAAVELSATP